MFLRERFKINRWSKALEITFDVNYEEFYDLTIKLILKVFIMLI